MAQIPGWLELLGFGTDFIVLAMLLNGLRLASKRTEMAEGRRLQMLLGITAILGAWYALVLNLAKHDVFRASPTGKVPWILFSVLVPVIGGLWLILRSRQLKGIIDVTPLSWLLAVQFYRIEGVVFLILWRQAQLPGQFAIPAGAGDFAVGMLAIPAAWAAGKNTKAGRRAAYLWNALGILDLLVALTTGFLSSPGRFQLLAQGHANVLASRYPLVMIPAFLVPLSLILHGLSLWKLRRTADAVA